MTQQRLLTFFVMLWAIAAAGPAFAQKEIGESVEMTREGVKAKTDSVYFEAVKAKMKGEEPLASKLFEQYTTIRPEVSDGWYELAKLSFGDKQLEKADAYIRKAIALSPDNKWYKEELATILGDEGQFAEAARVMKELSVTDPQDPGYLLMAAEYYDKAKLYNEALKCLDQEIGKKGPEEEILMLKEQVYLSMDSLERAADMVKLLTERDPRNGKYYKLLGDLYDNNKLPGKAANVYEEAEKIIPGDPYVQSGRAEHFLRIGDTASYVSYERKAIINKDQDAELQVEMLGDFIQVLPNDSVRRELGLPIIRELFHQHPADDQVYAVFGDFLENSGKHDSAEWAYSRSLQVKSSIEVWRKLLGVFWERREADSLIRNSEKFIRLYPNQVDPQFYNAQGHYLKQEYDKAIKAINRAIDNQPENDKPALAVLYSTMGEIYHASRQFDFSEKAYEKAISLDPDNAAYLNNYAYFLSVRGQRLEDAERMSKKSLDLKPGEATYLDTYGWIMFKKGDFEKAKVFVKRAIELAGSNADGTLYDHLGDIYFKLNNKAKAVEQWKLAKEKGTEDLLIDKKISEEKLYE